MDFSEFTLANMRILVLATIRILLGDLENPLGVNGIIL